MAVPVEVTTGLETLGGVTLDNARTAVDIPRNTKVIDTLFDIIMNIQVGCSGIRKR